MPTPEPHPLDGKPGLRQEIAQLFGHEGRHVHLHLCVLDGVVAQGRWGLVCRRWLRAGGPDAMFADNAIS